MSELKNGLGRTEKFQNIEATIRLPSNKLLLYSKELQFLYNVHKCLIERKLQLIHYCGVGKNRNKLH